MRAERIRRFLVGPAGPVLISAIVVLGFAAPHWMDGRMRTVPPQGAHLACGVFRVIDGDTVDLDCDGALMRVRIWGIDAPEMGQQPWGMLAKDHLQWLLADDSVVALVDGEDKYGRVVARLQRDHTDVGLQMVNAGKATVPTRYVKDARYREARKQAHKAGLGIWSVAGAQQKPWAWRRLNPRGGSR